MIHIKAYEKLYQKSDYATDWANTREPENDYVLCYFKGSDKLADFIMNTIGRVKEIRISKSIWHETDIKYFYVEYENIPDDIIEKILYNLNNKYVGTNTYKFELDEIRYWSKDKEDLELLLNSQKYNL